MSSFMSYVDGIKGNHHCRFQSKISTTDTMQRTRKILEKNENAVRRYITYFQASRNPIFPLCEGLYVVILELCTRSNYVT